MSSKVTRTARGLRKRFGAFLARSRRALFPIQRVMDFEAELHVIRIWLIKTRRFQLMLHERHSSDTADLHDHAWWNVTIVLRGRCTEYTPNKVYHLRPGSIRIRPPAQLHRLEFTGTVWTLFATGPSVREWGFMTRRGWKKWDRYIP
jgi:hypothetical protein